MKFSTRSSMNLTGRLNCIAASGTSTSSGWNIMIFWPKPPPTLGAMTRILSSSILNSEARPPRTDRVAWVLSHTVSSPVTSSQRAAIARHSMGAAVLRSIRTLILVMCPALAKASSVSPVSTRKLPATLLGTSRMYQRRTRFDRLLDIHLHRQRLIVDLDQPRRVLGNIAIDGDHHGDALTDVMNVAARQRAAGSWGA